jgi:hypothetical protein
LGTPRALALSVLRAAARPPVREVEVDGGFLRLAMRVLLDESLQRTKRAVIHA